MRNINVGKATIILSIATIIAAIITAGSLIITSKPEKKSTNGDCSPITSNINGNLNIKGCK